MLPGRIELTTSPLPRECSTTELRQHARGFIAQQNTRRKSPARRAMCATRSPSVQAGESFVELPKWGKIGLVAAKTFAACFAGTPDCSGFSFHPKAQAAVI